ncbi:N-formylglutamate amidohydrolase [Mesorhizobium sp. B2-5-13]|uniref:N-formylglutamate amidohydrolase n=1 Tax=unclassified Mesorhizobium TaxID=325217 RepID=UPI00112838CA|nr:MULTISPECIES: N-formylglutamate amidohydrolase [unclassified Mesorhizobium]TPJ81935.1 N-formylglutamate amidohydrolase [Mesorhizobium sp. B2-5-13]TPK45872.1 N-formylglutamate amidohydrolase [Mesorhizobium sp. B2-5-5]
MSTPNYASARPALEFVEETRAGEIVLLCEHASNFIADEYRQLGLDDAALRRHIAWDIGAAEVTRRLAAILGAPAFLGTYSRLLIDLNRPLRSSDSVPAHSEGTAIPGNEGLPASEIARREAMIFEPFHSAVSGYLDGRKAKGWATKLVTIHSFTPIYFGVARPWHFGVLFGRAEGFAKDVLNGIRENPSINAALNQPYVVSRDSDYAIPVHGDDRQIDAVLLEIRNDLIADEAGADRWAARLSAVLSDELSPRSSKMGAS